MGSLCLHSNLHSLVFWRSQIYVKHIFRKVANYTCSMCKILYIMFSLFLLPHYKAHIAPIDSVSRMRDEDSVSMVTCTMYSKTFTDKKSGMRGLLSRWKATKSLYQSPTHKDDILTCSVCLARNLLWIDVPSGNRILRVESFSPQFLSGSGGTLSSIAFLFACVCNK